MKGKKGQKGVRSSDASPKDVYAGGSSPTIKDAKEKKRGGRIDGKAALKRMDRPGRKRGGRVGSDRAPLSTAARVSPASAHKTEKASEPG